MKYGRKDPLLSVIPLDTFPDQFKEWWQTLQPPERGEVGDERPTSPIPAPSWSALQRSGRNGLYLVILGLFWWRHALETIVDGPGRALAHNNWESAAIDVLWVLSAWATHSSPSPSSTPPLSPSSSTSGNNKALEDSSVETAEAEGATMNPGRKRKRREHESVRGRKRKQ